MYEYKKKARELEAQMQAVRSTPAPQPVIEVREVVPDDVKARLEEREAELKKLQETLEAHKKAGKDLAGIEEAFTEVLNEAIRTELGLAPRTIGGEIISLHR